MTTGQWVSVVLTIVMAAGGGSFCAWLGHYYNRKDHS